MPTRTARSPSTSTPRRLRRPCRYERAEAPRLSRAALGHSRRRGRAPSASAGPGRAARTGVNAASAAALPIAVALAGAGWAEEQAFLAPAAVAALAQRLRQRAASGESRPAAVGAGAERQLRPDVRGDEIHWLVEPA